MIYFLPGINYQDVPENTIVIYGGSFSPMTIGHRAVIEEVMEILPNVKLFVVPVNDTYPKNIIKGKNSNGLHHRYLMCELMIRDIKKDHPEWDINISDWTFSQLDPFIDREIMNYYQEIYPENHLIYLCGLDVYETLPTWKEKDRNAILNDRFSLLVHPRNNIYSSTRLRETYFSTGEIIDTIPEIEAYLIEYKLLDELMTGSRKL